MTVCCSAVYLEHFVLEFQLASVFDCCQLKIYPPAAFAVKNNGIFLPLVTRHWKAKSLEGRRLVAKVERFGLKLHLGPLD